MEVFLLEDDAAIGMGLSYALENEGYKNNPDQDGLGSFKVG